MYLDGNRLTNLPKELSDLKYIQYLVLSRNNLTHASFPTELQGLSKLNTFDLRNNSLMKLPGWFGEYDGLEKLTIHGNPVCKNGWIESDECPSKLKEKIDMEGQGCTKQCSSFCLEAMLSYPVCTNQCNSKDCDYGGGHCL